MFKKKSRVLYPVGMEVEGLGIVLVDPQRAFTRRVPFFERRRILRNQFDVLDFADQSEVPVLTFAYSGWWHRFEKGVEDRLDEVKNGVVVKKYVSDGFKGFRKDGVNPAYWLVDQGVERLLFMGGFTSECLLSSAETARARGFEVMTAKDIIFDYKWEEDPVVQQSYTWFEHKGRIEDRYVDLLIG